MKSLTYIPFVSAASLLVCMLTLSSDVDDDPFSGKESTSVLAGWERLLVNPAHFNNKRIVVDGWLDVELDQESAEFHLYMDQESLRWRRPLRSLSLERRSFLGLLRKGGFGFENIDLQKFDRLYVEVTGEFVESNEEDFVAGRLSKVTKIGIPERWSYEKRVFQ